MKRQKLDKNVWTLGWVSLLTDISSEMIYPLLPIFLSSVLGVGFGFIGIIEGIAESTASILKVFSGWLSDKLKKRKFLILIGYGLSTISKPFLYFASLGWHVLLVRFLDRMGKGIRTSPRDALVADSSLPQERGRAFGFQRGMDMAGAFLGPVFAFLLLPLFNYNYRIIFLLAFIPALIAVLAIVFFIKERPHKPDGIAVDSPKLSIRGFKKNFKIFLLISVIFTLGNSSDAFIILRARDLGVSVIMIPVLWVLFNFFGSISSLPFGKLSDKIGRRKTITLGFLIYSFVYFGFAFSKMQYQVWALISLYGIYYGISEGVLRAYVADIVDAPKRATAYGIYHAAVGIFSFPASLLMGIFWQSFGPAFAFSFGAILSLVAAIAFMASLHR